MKTICGYCGSPISITCHCGAPLMPTDYVGSTFDRGAMVCVNGETAQLYTLEAIERMQVSHGLCESCSNLTNNQRDALVLKRREADQELPTPADMNAQIAERQIGETHEQRTRRAYRAAIHFTAHVPRQPKFPADTRLPKNKRGPTATAAAQEPPREKP
jgi:DNA/RNA endonuclease G (NUC1)